ncbi:MAG: 50S ribosomal protein L22 [uncultured bacterium (gcode 4)]|uniref:Large ribosomal subunit protein uL22 n=1 Tax=uncultured bacterium (gcode 4) TaxID=1234023 RepID=K2GXS1_9BACT|nr:MAG: 50S ribosomal protein L22 [uncultured bacterium (gcode 4)]
MKAYAKNIRISPKKLSVVASIVRNMPAKKALEILKFMPNKWGGILHKVVASAVANATNNDNQKMEDLTLGAVVIAKWVVYKRGNPISRGRSHAILKRTSNILVELKVK